MRKDITYMERKSHSLKRDIKRLLKIKFGKEVDINELEIAVLQRSFQKNMVNELEEVVLKKLVYELRIKMTDVRGLYIQELERWQVKDKITKLLFANFAHFKEKNCQIPAQLNK